MNSMDLFKAFGEIDEDLVFFAVNGSPQPQKSSGAAPAKQPKNNKPRRGGAKTKTILIGAVAMVLVAAIVCMILYFTGVFTKQVPIYTGMEISSANAYASSDSVNAVSYKYNGDYVGKGDNIDKDNPYGDGGTTLEDEVESTLTVTGAGEDIYYADAGEDIYITIKFDNPDYYKIESFVLYDGTTETHYADYMFESGSDYENIIIKLNVGNDGGIIEYTISEILYIDGNELKNVTMEGDTVVRCGVRTSDITYAEIQDDEVAVTFTSISFTVNIVDKYSLVSYSGGYLKAVLYDGESIIQTVDLATGANNVEFTNLSPNTLYQFAVVGYYDALNGEGITLNYLYINAVYTEAVVLFDNIEAGQESVTFGYSWAEGYQSTITLLTLTGGGTTATYDGALTSITGLLSDTEYTLTAEYTLTGGGTASISVDFTTEAKTAPAFEIEFIDGTTSSLTIELDITDTDLTGSVTSVKLYNGNALVKSAGNLNSVEYIFSGLSAYTEYTLKVVYTYNLNDGEGPHTIEQELSVYTDPIVTVNSISYSGGAISGGDTIYITAGVYNPSDVTYNSVVVNGVTYTTIGGSKGSTLNIDIVNNGQFAGGSTTLTLTQINCTIDDESYTIDITANNTVTVFINGELTVEDFYIARLNESGVYEETNYGLANEQLYYVISLGNGTKYDIDRVTIGETRFSSADITVSKDYQTVYIPVYTESVAATLSSISYSYDNDFSKTKSFNVSSGYFRALSSSDVVEITTAEQLLDVDDNAYYILMNNIDVSGYENEWVNMNNDMKGVFDGNGHTISGLGAVTTYYDNSLNIGLFKSADGIIMNLNVEAYYRVTLNNTSSGNYNVYVSGLAVSSNELYVDNVNVDITASITTYGNVNSITACGICCSVFGTLNILTNSTVNDNISITVKDGTVNGIEVGGLYGSINVQPYGTGEISDTDVTIKANVLFENSTLYTYGSINMGGLTGTATLYNDCILSNVSINRSLTLTGETSNYADGNYAGRTWYGTFIVN